MDRIIITELCARCIVGVNQEERREKQDVKINLSLFGDFSAPCRTDRFADAIDYRAVKKRVLDLVENSRYFLLEGLTEAIAHVCLLTPGVKQVQVRADKPSALRFARSVGVEILRATSGVRPQRSPRQPVVLTIGHSTRTLEEFIALLQAHGATRVVDVRTIPRSRHNPQFNRTSLPDALQQAGVAYTHLPELGGLRHAKRDSPNTGWENASFRGYADYMQTPEFDASLEELIRLTTRDRIALMCAEAVPWRCHRALIADALLVRGVRTEDILSATRRRAHALTPFAKVRGTNITYPVREAVA